MQHQQYASRAHRAWHLKTPSTSEGCLHVYSLAAPAPVVQFANLLALMAAWVFVFDIVAKEREMLETPEQDVYGGEGVGGRQQVMLVGGAVLSEKE